jgi:energy-converting hydrogenase B subunit Q
MSATRAFLIDTVDRPGVLHEITRVIAEHGVNIRTLESHRGRDDGATLSLELDDHPNLERLVDRLRALDIVARLEEPPTMQAIYGKRVIIIGGGAQVGQVAVGAVSEADRHNIRGERISVDTIPLVGEQNLAGAVRAVARLPRAQVLVLAGALMGGEVTDAVRDIQQRGLVVIALNMVGSVRDAADLVVTDPIQAGVLAVMAIADTATFDIARQRGRHY